jgi:hypothetical protein
VPLVHPASPGQEAETVGQSRLHAIQPQRGQLGGGQLDGQGDAVESLAEGRDPAAVVVRRRRPAHHGRPLDEQRHRVTTTVTTVTMAIGVVVLGIVE